MSLVRLDRTAPGQPLCRDSRAGSRRRWSGRMTRAETSATVRDHAPSQMTGAMHGAGLQQAAAAGNPAAARPGGAGAARRADHAAGMVEILRAGVRHLDRLFRSRQLGDRPAGRKPVRLRAAVGLVAVLPDRGAGAEPVRAARHRNRPRPRPALPRPLPAARRLSAVRVSSDLHDGDRPRGDHRGRGRAAPAVRHPAGRRRTHHRRRRVPDPPAQQLELPCHRGRVPGGADHGERPLCRRDDHEPARFRPGRLRQPGAERRDRRRRGRAVHRHRHRGRDHHAAQSLPALAAGDDATGGRARAAGDALSLVGDRHQRLAVLRLVSMPPSWSSPPPRSTRCS